MSKLKVVRLNLSPYQRKTFQAEEKQAIESISDIFYLEEDHAQSPDIIITNTHTNFDNLPSNFIKNLKLIIHPNSGYDNISANFIKNCKAPIILGNQVRSSAVSEYILSCLFKHFTSIPHHPSWVEGRKWERQLLRDTNVLILGYGHIGKIISASLRPIVKKLYIYDPTKEIEDVCLKRLPPDIDIIIPVMSLNSSSFQLLNEDFFRQLKSTCTLINGARGKLINQKDLLGFLKRNPKATAYLDVFEKEPFQASEFESISNLNKTSHIAGVYAGLDDDIINFVYNTIKDFKVLGPNNFLKKYKEKLCSI